MAPVYGSGDGLCKTIAPINAWNRYGGVDLWPPQVRSKTVVSSPRHVRQVPKSDLTHIRATSVHYPMADTGCNERAII